MLRKNFGAVVKTLWPVGVDVLTLNQPPVRPAYVSELAAASEVMFRKEWLGHDILTRARLRLHVTLSDAGTV